MLYTQASIRRRFVLGFVGKLRRRPESEKFFRLAKTAKQAILEVSSMQLPMYIGTARREKRRSKPDRVLRHSLILVLTLLVSPCLMAALRVHRIDKLGEHAKASPRFDHAEARAEASLVFPKLAEAQGWHFTQASDSQIFTDEGLRAIDVIIFDNNSGILFNEAEKGAFEQWVRQGGGVVGIHGATHAHKGVNERNEANWPFWYGLWGVLHKSGPKEGPLGRRGYADWIVMAEGTDPRWTRHLPKRWRFDKVEWYFWNVHANFSKVQVIATGDVKTNQPGLPGYYPVTWYHEYQGGRVWYTNMGHYAENFHQKEFIQHLIDGITWAGNE